MSRLDELRDERAFRAFYAVGILEGVAQFLPAPYRALADKALAEYREADRAFDAAKAAAAAQQGDA